MQLLDVCRLVRWDNEAIVDHTARLAAPLAEQRDDPNPFGPRRLGGPHHVGTLAARRVQHHQVPGTCKGLDLAGEDLDRKSTRLNSSHSQISYAVFCLKKKKNN